jgi:apolipoprotein N-acyltransferase
MTKAPAFSKNPLDPQSWITLAVAFTLLLLVGGRFVVPAAAWLGPLFMVRFLRGQTPKKGLLFAYAVLVATIFIGWQGMIPIPFVSVHIIVVLIIAIVMSLPYAIDRYLSPHATGILGTLILPVAWVSVDYLNNLFNP